MEQWGYPRLSGLVHWPACKKGYSLFVLFSISLVILLMSILSYDGLHGLNRTNSSYFNFLSSLRGLHTRNQLEPSVSARGAAPQN